MTINTTARGYPWPDNAEAVANGWDAIRDLAEAIDADVATGPRVLGYATHAANVGPVTAQVDVPDLSIPVDLPTGRLLRLSAFCGAWASTVATDFGLMRIMEGGTTLIFTGSVSSSGAGLFPVVLITPAAGAHTYKATVERNTGSGNGQFNGPMFLLVEDLGPA